MKTNHRIFCYRFVMMPICMGALVISAWTQTQGTYFSFRMGQLNEKLGVTTTQQRELRPIVEQETAELMQIVCNPSRSEKPDRKLNRFREIFKGSESRMRPILNGEQYRKVRRLNQDMLQEWKTRKPSDTCTMAYWGRKTSYQK